MMDGPRHILGITWVYLRHTWAYLEHILSISWAYLWHIWNLSGTCLKWNGLKLAGIGWNELEYAGINLSSIVFSSALFTSLKKEANPPLVGWSAGKPMYTLSKFVC